MKYSLLFTSAFLMSASALSAAEPIVVEPAAGADIAVAVAEETAGQEVGKITINLVENAAYTISASIVAPDGLVINGNGSTIDASALETPFILMSEIPTAELISDYYRVDEITVNNVTVSGLKNSIFYDNNVKYCAVNFTLDKVEFALATTEVKNEALIAFQGGGAKDFTVKNSTIYGNGEVAKYFVRYNNSARLDRYGFDKDAEFQCITYQNNTFYNLLKEDGQWANYSGISGQNYSKFDVEKNIWYNCGNDIIRRMAGGRFGSNPPLTFAYNTYFNTISVTVDEVTTVETVNTAQSEASYDKSGLILLTNPEFADAAAGDFKIGASTQQAQLKTGAPEWFTDFDGKLPAEAIEVTVGADGDIIEMIAKAVADIEAVGKLVDAITINLAENAEYALSAPITTAGSLVINGAGATITATELTEPFIQLSKLPAVGCLPEHDYYIVPNVTVSDLTVNDLKTSIFFDNNMKYCVEDFTFDNVEFALATTEVKNEALIAFQAGGAKDFTVKNSTIYGNGEVAKYFVRYNNSARLDRYGFDKDAEFQCITYQNNTFYNLLKEDGQWANYSGISGQNYSKFDVEKNIWYNCGNDIIRRMAGGRFGSNPPLTFAYNTYFNGGENTAESEASYDKSETILTSNPEFANPEEGNFTIGASTQQAEFQTGAPKWLVPYNPGTSLNEIIDNDANAPVEYFNLQGIRVMNPAKGTYIIRQGSKVNKVIM